MLKFKPSGGVRVRFRIRFQAVKVPIFDGFPLWNPTNNAIASKLFWGKFPCPSTVRRCSEYGWEGCVRVRFCCFLCWNGRPTQETRAEQCSDTVLLQKCLSASSQWWPLPRTEGSHRKTGKGKIRCLLKIPLAKIPLAQPIKRMCPKLAGTNSWKMLRLGGQISGRN